MSWMPSSMRAPRVRNGSSRASYSDSCQPTPTPSRTRPPDSVSRVLTCLATSTGCRCGSTSTSVPSVTRVVTAAM
jgi:hypothetical protein